MFKNLVFLKSGAFLQSFDDSRLVRSIAGTLIISDTDCGSDPGGRKTVAE